jgi:rubrerythrin
MIASLEHQVKQMTEQLEHETNHHRETKELCITVSNRLGELETKLEETRDEFTELRARGERHETERAKMYEFLANLAQLYDLAITTATIYSTSIENNLDVLLPRVQQKEERKASVDLKAVDEVRSKCEERVSVLNEQLASKEVHLSLLRKKLAEYEEKDGSWQCASCGDKETNAMLKCRVGKFREELCEVKAENVSLKATIYENAKILVSLSLNFYI